MTQTALTVSEQIDNSISNLFSSKIKTGFQRAYLVADAVQKLQQALTPEYMRPIVALMGKQIGFRTDKDTTPEKYSENVVRECLIEAVISGVEPTGNQFNIIAGRCYITKEGYGHLLSKVDGLNYRISFELPRINDKSAAVRAIIEWQILNGEKQAQILDLPIKVNSFMGADGVLGKAERKARKWLYTHVSGVELPDDDVSTTNRTVNVPHEVISENQQLVDSLNTFEELEELKINNPDDAELVSMIFEKQKQLNLKTK